MSRQRRQCSGGCVESSGYQLWWLVSMRCLRSMGVPKVGDRKRIQYGTNPNGKYLVTVINISSMI